MPREIEFGGSFFNYQFVHKASHPQLQCQTSCCIQASDQPEQAWPPHRKPPKPQTQTSSQKVERPEQTSQQLLGSCRGVVAHMQNLGLCICVYTHTHITAHCITVRFIASIFICMSCYACLYVRTYACTSAFLTASSVVCTCTQGEAEPSDHKQAVRLTST